MKEPSEKWLNKTVTISRGEVATIVAEKANEIIEIAKLIDPDPNFTEHLQETLLIFAANVCAEMFGGKDELEVEE